MHTIIALAGDGIGPEIMAAALDVLQAASKDSDFQYQIESYDFGGASIDQFGQPLQEATIQAAQRADAILLGAIGGPQWTDSPQTPEDGLLSLRQALELFANIRPTKVQSQLIHISPFKEEVIAGTDLIILRELIGGIYFGKPKYYNNDEAFDTMYYSRQSIERIIKQAFELARQRRKKLTSVDKANVLANSKLWRQIVDEMAVDYPDVQVDHLLVDAAAMKLMSQPTSFDVIVTENLFGDILSDQATVIMGSLGMAPSASLSANGPSLYEPIHGSAPDIAGQDKANPMSMILSVTMMLRMSFGEEQLADKIEEACQIVMDQGILTTDMGGQASTSQFTQAVIDQIKLGGSH